MTFLRHTCPVVAALWLMACGPQPAPQMPPAATLQELMQGQIDPAADALWEAVATTVTRQGVDEQHPRTPEAWAAVRRQALQLVQAADLLAVPGRQVARQPFPAEAQGALDSAQIAGRISAGRAAFNRFAAALGATSQQAVSAIDAHDAGALLAAGGRLDAVCEACHLQFWYPLQVIPPLPGTPPGRTDAGSP